MGRTYAVGGAGFVGRDPMGYLSRSVPQPPLTARAHDPLAVAIGNASLLGAGYLLLGRRRLAAVTGLVTVVLGTFHTSIARSTWSEILVLLWWAALVGHGFILADGRASGLRSPVRGQRLVALGVAAPVLLAVGLLRFDAAGIEGAVTDARRSGDCSAALTALDGVRLEHRVVDAPLTVRGERTAEACQRLQLGGANLTAASTGNTLALQAGFDVLAGILAELPGHEKMVDTVLGGFLERLPAAQPCQLATLTDWLRQRPPDGTVLDRSADIVAPTAPAALTGCGDELMAAEDWPQARDRYQQLLDQYPGDALAATASAGVERATVAIELVNVRGLLSGPTSTQPGYCSTPARYRAATPYRRGNNRAMIYGNDDYAKRLPASWRATDAAEAVLVVCAGEETYGAAVRTCPYENKRFPEFPTYVTFHKVAIPVKVYELRTGKLVANTKVQIGGASCPRILTYTTYYSDFGPPSQVYVAASDADVRAGFRALLNR
jgi:hypothetical protein